MTSNKVSMLLHENKIIISNLNVPIISSNNISPPVNNNLNCHIDSSVQHDVSSSSPSTDAEVPAYLTSKVVMNPFKGMFTYVRINKQPKGSFLFSPLKSSLDISCEDSIHDSSAFINNHNNSSSQEHEVSNVSPESNNNSSNQDQHPLLFEVFIQNHSDKVVHLNKNMCIGTVSEIDDDDIQQYPPELLDNKSNSTHLNRPHSDVSHLNCSDEVINHIIPSPEVIAQRKADLKETDFKLSHLPPSEQQQLLKLLLDQSAAFSKSMKTLGHTDVVNPEIDFIQNIPLKTLPFPVPHYLQEEALRQLNEMKEAGIIDRSISSWACPMLLVKKKITDQSKAPQFRLALDLRLLNSIIRGSTYPLPRISAIINNLSKFKFFTTLDLPSAYWQINLPENLQDYLSFTTPWGSFKFRRLVFGLKTAASIFQFLMDTIIEKANISGVYAYQDDILIAANSFEESYSKIKKLLEILVQCNITLNPAKCSFHASTIQYLGFQICNNQILPISSNITKIVSFPTPKTKRQTKRFLGICGYYRHLIPAYASLTKPLIDISSPKAKFKWSDSHQKAFSTIQDIFLKQPFLRMPDWNKKFILNTDASIQGISAVLMQQYDDKLLPVSYFSKSLTPAETRYPAIQLELMAIYKGIIAFKQYLYNTHFVILSDSKPLSHYKRISSPADITTRWLMEISEYSFEFQHIPGKDNVLADYLSRLESSPKKISISQQPEIINSEEILPLEVNLISDTPGVSVDPQLDISTETMVTEQHLDSTLSPIIQSIINNNSQNTSNQYFINPDDDILYFINPKHDDSPKIVVPTKLIPKVLAIAHVSHQGISKTYAYLQQKFFWKRMYADTANFIASCHLCIQAKKLRIPKAPLQFAPLPKIPGEEISLDLVGPFANGKHILTIVDRFSRFLQLYSMHNITASTVASKLMQYISSHGRPTSILTDLGSQFTSTIFKVITKSLGIHLRHTTTGHPQANSISERVNSAIKSSVNSLTQQGFNFETCILIHQSIYNSSQHSTTTVSPNLLHYGRELSHLYDVFQLPSHDLPLNSSQYLSTTMASLQAIFKKVYSTTVSKQQQQNLEYSNKFSAKLRKFQPKDIVYIKTNHPFKPKFIGPFQVIRKNSDVTYEIRRHDHPVADSFIIHIDRLIHVHRRKSHLIENQFNSHPYDDADMVPLFIPSNHQHDEVVTQDVSPEESNEMPDDVPCPTPLMPPQSLIDDSVLPTTPVPTSPAPVDPVTPVPVSTVPDDGHPPTSSNSFKVSVSRRYNLRPRK